MENWEPPPKAIKHYKKKRKMVGVKLISYFCRVKRDRNKGCCITLWNLTLFLGESKIKQLKIIRLAGILLDWPTNRLTGQKAGESEQISVNCKPRRMFTRILLGICLKSDRALSYGIGF